MCESLINKTTNCYSKRFSGETLNTLAHPTKNQTEDERVSKLKSNSTYTKDVESTNNNHSNRGPKDAYKEKTSGEDDTRSNNNPDKKLKTHDSHTMSQKQDSSIVGPKKLSFFHDDEDSDGSSDPLHSQRSTSTKRSNDITKSNTDDSDISKEGQSVPAATKIRDYKAKGIESDHEDASSTSSCSCEDHSSVAGRSDDLHEDLDYDEDSIVGSPNQESGNVGLVHEQTNPSTSSSTSVTKNTSSINSIKIDSNAEVARACSEKQSIDDQHESQANDQDTHSLSRPRIKSIINFNHYDQNAKDLNISVDGTKYSSDKSHKSYDCLLKYFFKDACYFQIKSINHENVELSKSMGVWSTPVQNEIRLNAAFQEHRNVILIFSVQQSGGFQGFARMISESKPTARPIPWVLPERLSNRSLGGVFEVEWLCTRELSFHETHDLYNPFNGNKPVKIARDGQQVEPKIGKKLCRLFPHDSKKRLLSSLATLKRQTSQRKKSSHRHDNFYPLTNRRSYPEDWHRHNYNPLQGIANGFGEPSGVPSHLSHDYSSQDLDYRNVNRRKIMDPPNHAIYHRPSLYPSHYGSVRPYHMPRNVDNMPRCLMPSGYGDFHPSRGFTSPPNHQYPNPYDSWGPPIPPDASRFHPYQRHRR